MRTAIVLALIIITSTFLTLFLYNKKISSDKFRVRGGLYFEIGEKEPYTGVILMTYPNGKRKGRLNVLSGKKHGAVIQWYENGNEKSEHTFSHGELHGKTILWHENGVKSQDVNYQDGHKHGNLTEWDEDGGISFSFNFKGGILDGKASAWYEDGSKVYDINFKEGSLDGSFVKYYKDAEKEKFAFKEGTLIFGSKESFEKFEELIDYFESLQAGKSVINQKSKKQAHSVPPTNSEPKNEDVQPTEQPVMPKSSSDPPFGS